MRKVPAFPEKTRQVQDMWMLYGYKNQNTFC